MNNNDTVVYPVRRPACPAYRQAGDRFTCRRHAGLSPSNGVNCEKHGAPRASPEPYGTGQASGTIITPRWGEHPVPEDQFTHGQGRGPLGTGIDKPWMGLILRTVHLANKKTKMISC